MPGRAAIASVLAQDAACGVSPPDNGRLVRNIMAAANFIQSHILHFYTLSAIDFIDITAVLQYQGRDPAMNYLKGWVESEIRSTNYYPAAPFLPRMEGSYATDPALNLGAIRNYLKALEMRVAASKLCALLGGKLPHVASIIPGGATIRVGGRMIADCLTIIRQLRDFIDRCYVPDVLAVASAFPEYYQIGRGPGNFLSYGVFHENADGSSKLLPSGVLADGTLETLDQTKITEDVGCSWFSSASSMHPLTGDTTPAPNKTGAYSWVKAPRYDGRVMEVGPLARMLVAYISRYQCIVPTTWNASPRDDHGQPGAIVVGIGASQADNEVFVWDADHGMRSLSGLCAAGGLPASGYRFTYCRPVISEDGDSVAGDAIAPDQSQVLWRLSGLRSLLEGLPTPPVQLAIHTKGVTLRFMAEAGFRYQVQQSENLTTGTWSDVGTPVLGDGLEHEIAPANANFPSCFYRLVISNAP